MGLMLSNHCSKFWLLQMIWAHVAFVSTAVLGHFIVLSLICCYSFTAVIMHDLLVKRHMIRLSNNRSNIAMGKGILLKINWEFEK